MHQGFKVGGLLLGMVLAHGVLAQTGKPGAGTSNQAYTCVDSQGRRLLSDRPIPECLDREQSLLGPSGVERKRIGPSMTQQERIQAAQKAEREREERARVQEQQRMDRALLQRYANKAAHDAERQLQMQQLEERQNLARARLEELERVRLQAFKDLAPYQSKGEKPPARLISSLEDADEAVAAQRRTIESNEIRRNRTLLRFDDELQRLEKLWAEQAAAKQIVILP